MLKLLIRNEKKSGQQSKRKTGLGILLVTTVKLVVDHVNI
nr:MAG TPA: hypothetical protein [Caudoviricetes sp.]DAT27475.1 MAG TPA: hypothetical protein [Caudoviricetes sp.]